MQHLVRLGPEAGEEGDDLGADDVVGPAGELRGADDALPVVLGHGQPGDALRRRGGRVVVPAAAGERECEGEDGGDQGGEGEVRCAAVPEAPLLDSIRSAVASAAASALGIEPPAVPLAAPAQPGHGDLATPARDGASPSG